MTGRTVALIYHDVAGPERRDGVGFPGPVAGLYKLTPERFSAHLKAVAATGVSVTTEPGQPGAMLTFDDGGASAAWVADELERHGFRGAFFVVTSRLGTPGFLDADTVCELARRGHLIGSHSDTHPSAMARLPAAVLGREWRTSRERLGELLGAEPLWAAAPGGSISAELERQVELAGYTRLYTSTPTLRERRRGALVIAGRFTIWARDPASLAASLVRGDPLPRLRRRASWQLRAGARRVSPHLYSALRTARAGTRALN